VSEFETAIDQWREGERLLRAADPAQRATLERVTERLVAELRKRLGSTFTTTELVALYDQGTSWCLEVAVVVAPDAPWAWDQRVVADAAFGRYVREATDYAGGVRIESERV
jgi:hypothetical protein